MRQYQPICCELLAKSDASSPRWPSWPRASWPARPWPRPAAPAPSPRPKAETEAKRRPRNRSRPRPASPIRPHPTYDEGTARRISAAMLSYSTLEVRGGWPTLPAERRQARARRVRARGGAAARAARHHRRPRARARRGRRLRRQSHRRDPALPVPPRAGRDRHRRAAHARRAQRAGDAAAAPARGLARPARRMDFTFGHKYVVVNIPAAVAEAVENGRVVRRHATIVGKPRPAVADAHHAPHRGQSQSDLDGAARHPEEGHPHQDAPRSRLRRAHAHARARRLRPRDRSGLGRIGIPTARRISRCGRIPAASTRSARALRHAESAFGLSARHQQPLAVQRRLPLPVVGLRAHRKSARPRGLAAAGSAGLEPCSRSTPRSRPGSGRTSASPSKVPVAWVYLTGWVTPRQRHPFPRRHLQSRHRAVARAGGVAAGRRQQPMRGRRASCCSRPIRSRSGSSRSRISTASRFRSGAHASAAFARCKVSSGVPERRRGASPSAPRS